VPFKTAKRPETSSEVVGVKRVALLPAIKVDENGQGYISEEVKQ
jgi:hypothetical protein